MIIKECLVKELETSEFRVFVFESIQSLVIKIILSLFFYRNDTFNMYFVYSSEEEHQTTCNTSTCWSRANQNASKPTGEFKVPTSAHTPKLEKVHATWVYLTHFVFKRCMLFHPNTNLKIEIGNARISKTSFVRCNINLINISSTTNLFFSNFRVTPAVHSSTMMYKSVSFPLDNLVPSANLMYTRECHPSYPGLILRNRILWTKLKNNRKTVSTLFKFTRF